MVHSQEVTKADGRKSLKPINHQMKDKKLDHSRWIVAAASLWGAMTLSHVLVAVQEVCWLDQGLTPVEKLKPALKSAAAELVQNPSLEVQLNQHLRETMPGLNPGLPTVRKLEARYAQLVDHRPGVAQAWAASAAEFFGKLKSSPIVMEGLKHPSMGVQLASVRALGELGYRPAADVLIELLRRNNFEKRDLERPGGRSILRQTLIKALGQITGLDFSQANADDVRSVEDVIAQCVNWIVEHASAPGDLHI